MYNKIQFLSKWSISVHFSVCHMAVSKVVPDAKLTARTCGCLDLPVIRFDAL